MADQVPGQAKPRPRRPISGGRGCLVGLVVFVGSFVASMVFLEWFGRERVVGPPPKNFPMIVLAGTTQGGSPVAYLVTGEHLERFRKEHPDHSFLIPEGREHEVGRQLGGGDDQYAGGLFVAGFDVEPAGSGRQRVKVHAPWNSDAINVGAYEAAGREITPLYAYTSHSMTESARTMALTVVLSFLILSGAALAEWFWMRRKGALPQAS